MDGLASLLLALLLFVFVAVIHIPAVVSGDFMGVVSMMRDTAMAGAALLYDVYVSADKRFTGLSQINPT